MADDQPALTDANLDEIRVLLLADRERTERLLASLAGTFTSIVAASQDTANDDEHDPEGSTIAFERSQTSTLLSASRSRLVDIDAALTRIADGRYGFCERCGRPIPLGRLEARPTALTCVSCAT
ncbi:TraR/DksA C4-type zinc finger protein [Microbacterium oryzae]|uniref:Molecular chaperone DnaK n=1 Tax=Microbacterium oryzae TaxID=743009 RepID=A0A6I6DWJ6_9MICO|nr:TraR/DksA C4-type zinc finger protein [Microbacterium oryzae]QGU27243.1 molecular chaperone DnaK [Microbacterium oryzae]